MKKKNFFYLMLMMFVGIGLLASCKDDTDEPTPEAARLTVSLSNIEKGSEGGNVEVDVNSNTKWYVSGATDWCTVNPKQGENNGIFEVSISENTKSKERKCTLKVRTSDGAIVEEIAVTQYEYAKEYLTATSQIEFTKDKGNKKVMQISSNVSWEITGIPDWLDCSQRSGNDSRDVEFTTKTENTKGARSATLTVRATGSSSLSATVEVTQEGKAGVKVMPKGLISLSYNFAFLPQPEGNIKRYKVNLVKADNYKLLSESDILEIAKKGKTYVDCTQMISVNYKFDEIDIEANTDYYLLTLAFDRNDEEGEVVKTKFRTKPDYIYDDAQAIVAIGDLYTNGEQVWWEATPNGSTDSYYTAFLCGLSEEESNELCYTTEEGKEYWDIAKLVWMLNNEIENKSGTYKVKRGAAEILEEKGYYINNNRIVARGRNSYQIGYAIFITWGVNISDQQMSGYIGFRQTYVSSFNSSGKQAIHSSEQKIKCPEKK